jgi:hypothetical protein
MAKNSDYCEIYKFDIDAPKVGGVKWNQDLEF